MVDFESISKTVSTARPSLTAWRLLLATALAVVLALAVAAGALAGSARVASKRPPLVSRIVEGTSLGGVALGMHSNEVEGAWGSPNQHSCHGTQSLGDRIFDGLLCNWGSKGSLTVVFDEAGDTVRYVVAYALGARRPQYRRWKTAGDIGLGSSIAQLQRAYGSKLRKVPYRDAGRFPENERRYYVLTSRGGTRWVTVFWVPVISTTGQPYAAFQIDHAEEIEIFSAADFRAIEDGYAKPSWRP